MCESRSQSRYTALERRRDSGPLTNVAAYLHLSKDLHGDRRHLAHRTDFLNHCLDLRVAGRGTEHAHWMPWHCSRSRSYGGLNGEDSGRWELQRSRQRADPAQSMRRLGVEATYSVSGRARPSHSNNDSGVTISSAHNHFFRAVARPWSAC